MSSSWLGEEFAREPGTPLSTRVAEWFRSRYNNVITRQGLGQIALTLRGIKDSWMHGQSAKKAAAFAAVPDVIEQGRIIRRVSNYKPGVDRIIIAAPVSIAGEHHTALVIVQKDANAQRFYLHEVFTQQTKTLRTSSTARTPGEAKKRSGTDAEALQSIADGLLLVNPKDISIHLNENGEPDLK
jgi:hypothetical protein